VNPLGLISPPSSPGIAVLWVAGILAFAIALKRLGKPSRKRTQLRTRDKFFGRTPGRDVRIATRQPPAPVCRWKPAAFMGLLALLATVGVLAGLLAADGRITLQEGSTTGRGRAAAMAESGKLAELARQVRTASSELTETRCLMAERQAQSTKLRQHIADLDAMLANGDFLRCPTFLWEDAAVRALQQVVREATENRSLSEANRSRLETAAMIARQRLRSKFGALRENMVQSAKRLDEETEALRAEIQSESQREDSLHQRLTEQLKLRAETAPPTAYARLPGSGPLP